MAQALRSIIASWQSYEPTIQNMGPGIHFGIVLDILTKADELPFLLFQTFHSVFQNSVPELVFEERNYVDHPFAFAAMRALLIIPLRLQEIIFSAKHRLRDMRTMQAVSHQEGRPFSLKCPESPEAPKVVMDVFIMTMTQNIERAKETAAIFQNFFKDQSGKCHIWSAYSAKPFHLSGHIGLWCSIVDHYLPSILRCPTFSGEDRKILFLEDDARPAEGFHMIDLRAISDNWQELQVQLHHMKMHPTALCVIGFHPRCDYPRNHTLDTRPRHGMHGWITSTATARGLLKKLQGIDPLDAPPIDVWLFEKANEMVAQTTESVLGYVAHVSDTESFHRQRYEPQPLTALNREGSLLAVPVQIHPCCD
jgi:hypothetical protein